MAPKKMRFKTLQISLFMHMNPLIDKKMFNSKIKSKNSRNVPIQLAYTKH